MKITDFTEHKDVLLIVDELKKTLQEKRDNGQQVSFSDIRDKEGNYYVDLVQEGGGVLGVALVGYTYILEQVGIRFLKLAGTSAGAINTMIMAAAGKPQEAKSAKIVEILANTDLNLFVDGDSDAQKFITSFNKGAGSLKLIVRGVQILDNLKEDLGLNPGDEFYNWISKILQNFGIKTVADLCERMYDLPPEVIRSIGDFSANDYPIAIIAADITTETKAIFPEMGHLYFTKPDEVNPAFFVRASMSIPLFFKPLLLEELPDTIEIKKAWNKDAKYRGPHPQKIQFLDGGILSNFPIDIFHIDDRMPRRPTLGIKLGLDRDRINEVDEMNYKKLIWSSFEAARLMRDSDFINKHPDFQKLVGYVEIGDHNWLNFELTKEQKIDLFIRGAKAAANFIKNFNWERYKQTRRRQLTKVVTNLLPSAALHLEKAGIIRQNVMHTRGIEVNSAQNSNLAQATTQKRLQLLNLEKQKFQLLWIDDDRAQIKDYKSNEINLIKEIGGEIDFANSSAEAEEKLLSNTYQIIISDIKRDSSDSEGINFLNRLVGKQGVENVPPTIFYISDFSPDKGRPKFAFGITNSPTELVHLIADILQRQP